MKAAVCKWGDVEIREIAKPVPKDNEVLVRVHASTICAADYRLKNAPRIVGWAIGLRGNTVLGMELAGTVEAVGKDVTRFGPGDQVFGATGFKFGTHAEYVCVRELGLEKKPDNMSLEESAAIMFGALTALCFMRKANIQPGQNVLVYGASGSVGVYAVQLAKHWGARVTAVCSTANVEMVKWLGADQVVDYTTQDFSAAGRVFDLAFDTVGKAKPSRVLKVLKRGSPYVMIAPSEPAWAIPFHMVQQMWISLTGAAKIIGGVTKLTPGDHAFFKRLIEAGELKTVIDRRYSLANIADAFRYAEAGHKKGHVLILAE